MEFILRARSLLLEEYPLAENDLKREEGKWILRTVIHSLEGAGRFVIGLAAYVKILEGDALRGGPVNASGNLLPKVNERFWYSDNLS